MSFHYTSLESLGNVALSHRGEVDEVKQRLGIGHGYFDCWIYGFLENKKFQIDETVAKLHRRFAMEVNELATYEWNDCMRQSLCSGIGQEIGKDKLGRTVFYVTSKRDTARVEDRDIKRKTFDMLVSYCTRLCKDSKRCQMVMLINHEDASLFKNVDMGFQADIALRISKFYPGMVDKMYICNMGGTLATLAKPIFKRLPSIVSDRIEIITARDRKDGYLLTLMDWDVLPTALGGGNDCDWPEQWCAFADRIEKYYTELKRAVNERGLTVKEWELEQLGVEPVGHNACGCLLGDLKSMRHCANGEKRAHNSPENSSLSFEDLVTMYSCHSEECCSCVSDEQGCEYPWQESITGQISWHGVMSSFAPAIALFLLEGLLRCRTETETQELCERYTILNAAVAEMKCISDKNEFIAKLIPNGRCSSGSNGAKTKKRTLCYCTLF